MVCLAGLLAGSPASPGSAQWRSYGASPGGGHYSPLTLIDPANVDRLELAWTHRSGDVRLARKGKDGAQFGDPDGPLPQSSLQVTPIVVDDTLYYCTPFNRVFALDAATGRERWVFDPQVDTSRVVLTNCRGVSSWQNPLAGDTSCNHRIFTGTLDGRLIALDGDTGRPCEDFGERGQVSLRAGLGEHLAHEYGITSPPAILGDLAITGAMVLDNYRLEVPSGVVRAYDVDHGELVWAWNPVPEGMEKLNADGTYRSGTANVWSCLLYTSDAADELRSV